jgi:dihydroorotate dehydrogenase
LNLYSTLARRVLFELDAERAHDLTMAVLRTPIAPAVLRFLAPAPHPALQQQAFGLTFSNPVGLAAGLDKQGTAVAAWTALGFGFAEIGTVTPRPQPGNPKPRLFRVADDRVIINRFGFNSAGAVKVARNLAAAADRTDGSSACRLGINIGKNKETPNEVAVDDYLQAVEVLHHFADYFVVNVSSPNTAGLRALQDRESLRPLMEQVVARVKSASGRRIPVLVKVSPDMDDHQLLAAVDAAVEGGAQGVIATNTTVQRRWLESAGSVTREEGGLSGWPLHVLAHEACRTLYRHLRGQVPIVGVGGILTADHAYQRIRAGAALIQLYSGLIFDGPSLVSHIADGVARLLARDGFSSVAEAVGVDVT